VLALSADPAFPFKLWNAPWRSGFRRDSLTSKSLLAGRAAFWARGGRPEGAKHHSPGRSPGFEGPFKIKIQAPKGRNTLTRQTSITFGTRLEGRGTPLRGLGIGKMEPVWAPAPGLRPGLTCYAPSGRGLFGMGMVAPRPQGFALGWNPVPLRGGGRWGRGYRLDARRCAPGDRVVVGRAMCCGWCHRPEGAKHHSPGHSPGSERPCQMKCTPHVRCGHGQEILKKTLLGLRCGSP